MAKSSQDLNKNLKRTSTIYRVFWNGMACQCFEAHFLTLLLKYDKKSFCVYLYGYLYLLQGDLLIMNALTAEPYCGCDPLLLRQYYFSPLQLCYEHHTRGPCEIGLLFAYNHTAELTHCMCNHDLANYHPETQQCFQFGTKGPCQKGQVILNLFNLRNEKWLSSFIKVFELDPVSGHGECRCRNNYVFWPQNGECYKTFTPGPCNKTDFIVPSDHNPNMGQCILNPCPRAHLFFPEESSSDSIASYVSSLRSASSQTLNGNCYKVGSRGPCPLGKLVVFERYSGKSFRGECGCSAGYNQNYWPETDQCYEWYSQGPCKDSFLFAYNRDEGKTECICDEQEGYVYWNETGKCYRVYSQGPCPENAWLIPADDLSEVFCECKAGYQFSPESYVCKPTAVLETLGIQMLPYLNTYKKMLTSNHPRRKSGGNRKMDAGDERVGGIVQWTRGIFVTPAGQNGRGRHPAAPGAKHGSDHGILATEKELKDIPKRLISSGAILGTKEVVATEEGVEDSSYEKANYRSRRRLRHFTPVQTERRQAQMEWWKRYQARRRHSPRDS